MALGDLLVDAFNRIRDIVEASVDGLNPDQLTQQIDTEANTIAWLVWHLTRIQDDHIAAAAGDLEQVWHAQGWVDRFGLPFDRSVTGYGHSKKQVSQVTPSADLLLGYHNAVHHQTCEFAKGLDEGDLDRVVDVNWDPPVTLGVRLVSVISDDLQHGGQARFIRGVIEE